MWLSLYVHRIVGRKASGGLGWGLPVVGWGRSCAGRDGRQEDAGLVGGDVRIQGSCVKAAVLTLVLVLVLGRGFAHTLTV